MLNRVAALMGKPSSLTPFRRGTGALSAFQPSSRFFATAPCSCDEVKDDCDCFHTFGVERNFSISLDELKATYKKLMNDLHPDRHTLKEAEERDQFTEQASDVTRCYDVVSDPQSRALYLLELMGKPMDENDKGALVGSSFLMEVMEIREKIDNTSLDNDLQLLYNENKDRMDRMFVELETAFENNDLDEARRLTAMLQYWNRVEETLREKMSVVE